jgi:hypothetical protein
MSYQAKLESVIVNVDKDITELRNWKDRNGEVLSRKIQICILVNKSKKLRANYLTSHFRTRFFISATIYDIFIK